MTEATRLFLILHDVVPKNGNTIMKSFFGTVVTGVRFSVSKILLKNIRIHLSTNLEGYPFFPKIFFRFSNSVGKELYDEEIW